MMDFRLDDEQLALQDAVRGFGAVHFPLDRVAAREGQPVDRAQWRELAALGVIGVMAPPSMGGAGLGAVEAAIALEQLGRHLAPGPVLWSVLAAPHLPGVADGERLVAGLDGSPPDGDPILVEHAADLDTLLVVRSDGLFACERAALPEPVPAGGLDPLTPVGRYPTLPDGPRVAGPEAVPRVRHVGATLAAALLVGVSATALDTARAYALEREQFGVKIGSFQAIKHLLADMYVRTALARSATYAAAAVLEDPDGPDPASGAHEAKLLAGEAAIANAKAAVQILGGMGFTWAMLPHHLLRRAWVLEHTFGTADAHALALAARVDVGR
jgi:alkylation response protein AidB-like acyl-CoA dehydrogenase